MAAVDYLPLTQLVYIAYFGRPADPGGLQAFAASLDSLKAPGTVAELSAQYGVPGNTALRALIDGFGASAESARLYSAGTTGDFVRGVFENVLHRAPAAAGLAYWTAELDSGRVGKAEAALKIMAGAFLNTTNPAQAALDQNTIGYKLAAASYFTEQLDALGASPSYKGEHAAWQGRYLLSQVDAVNASALFRPTVLSAVRQIAGQEPVTAPLKLAAGAGFSGGDAAERVLVGAQAGTVATGGGDDTVFLAASSVAGTLDGGAGTDTLAMSGVDAAAASLTAAVSGFERLLLTSVTTQTIDLDRLGGMNDVVLGGSNPRAVNGAVLDNVASGATVAVEGTATAFTVNVKNAAAGAADLLTLSLSSDKQSESGKISVAHVETIALRAVDRDRTTDLDAPRLTLEAPDTKTLSLAGLDGIQLYFRGKSLTSVDAIMLDGPIRFSLAEVPDGLLTIRAGTGGNVFNLYGVKNGIHYVGGGHANTVAVDAGINIIETGNGRDDVNVLGGSNTVDLGWDRDTVRIFNSGANVVSGGGDIDEFWLFDPGADSASQFTTITDYDVRERIRFAFDDERYVAEARLGAPVDAGPSAGFQQLLDAAAAGATWGELDWFVFGGDTYLVLDHAAAATFQNGVDQLVKLAGAFDLSGASFGPGGDFLGFAV